MAMEWIWKNFFFSVNLNGKNQQSEIGKVFFQGPKRMILMVKGISQQLILDAH